MLEITGIEEAAENYTACLNSGLSPRIVLDRATGEVWISELVSDSNVIVYRDESVADVTADALEEQRVQTLAAFDPAAESAPRAPFAGAVLAAARRACAAWAGVAG